MTARQSILAASVLELFPDFHWTYAKGKLAGAKFTSKTGPVDLDLVNQPPGGFTSAEIEAIYDGILAKYEAPEAPTAAPKPEVPQFGNLLDDFAMAALTGLLAQNAPMDAQDLASWAYRIADAMFAESKRRQGA